MLDKLTGALSSAKSAIQGAGDKLIGATGTDAEKKKKRKKVAGAIAGVASHTSDKYTAKAAPSPMRKGAGYKHTDQPLMGVMSR